MVEVEKLCLAKVPTVKPNISGDFSKIMTWADKYRKLKVRTNSETPADTKIARGFWRRRYWLMQNGTYVF